MSNAAQAMKEAAAKLCDDRAALFQRQHDNYSQHIGTSKSLLRASIDTCRELSTAIRALPVAEPAEGVDGLDKDIADEQRYFDERRQSIRAGARRLKAALAAPAPEVDLEKLAEKIYTAFGGSRSRWELLHYDLKPTWIRCAKAAAAFLQGTAPAPEVDVAATAIAAFQKIIDMNVQYAVDRYGDATRAESMSCVTVSRAAIAALQGGAK